MTFSPRMTLAAVLIAGITAGFVVSPVAFATTIVVAGLLARGFHSSSHALHREETWPGFSDDARNRVTQTLRDVPEGEAQRALLEITVCARSLLAAKTGAFDPSDERATRHRVEQLLDACCSTALELGRLDEAIAGTQGKIEGDSLERLVAARALLAARLSAASHALRELYAADLTHGGSASERVAELTRELTEDAVARGAALRELSELLASERASRAAPTARA